MVYEEKIKIEAAKCDESGRMHLSDIALELQNLADRQLKPLGLRGPDIRGQGYMWVLVKRYMEFKRFPRAGEELQFYTWTAKSRHGFCPRRYRIAAGDEILMDTVCQWVVIDDKNREMVADPGFLDELPEGTMPGELKMPKMPKAWPELTERRSKLASDRDIDANGHVNNSRYLAWAMEIWDEHSAGEDPKTVMIEYTKEVMAGEELALCYAFEGDKLYLRGEHGGNTNFSIIMGRA